MKRLALIVASLVLLTTPLFSQSISVSPGIQMAPDAGNAILPQARNNINYTPPSCDGQKGVTGSLPTGSTTLTIPTAKAVTGGITKAYVGEKITVEKAGANYFALSVAGGSKWVDPDAFNATDTGPPVLTGTGGTGYKVDEVLTFSTGVKLRVRQIDTATGAIMEADWSTPGNLSTNPFYTGSTTAEPKFGYQIIDVGDSATAPTGAQSQTATTGSGTGATFTFTWQRTNLITTIAAINSDTEVVLATANQSGATLSNIEWGFATDISATINTRLSEAMPPGDGLVSLPAGVCGIASTLNYINNSAIVGVGRGTNRDASTALIWLGPHRGTMISNGDPPGAISARFEYFELNGMGAAGTLLRSHGDSASRFSNLALLDAVNLGWDIDASSQSHRTPSIVRIPFIVGDIANVNVTYNRSGSTLARGVVIGAGTDASDTNFTTIQSLFVLHMAGTGFEIGASDRSMILNYTGQSSQATAWSLELKCSNNQDPTSGVFFGKASGWEMFQMQPLRGTVVRNKDCKGRPVANMMYLSRENGAPNPDIEPGGELLCTTTKGRNCGSSTNGMWAAAATNTVDITTGTSDGVTPTLPILVPCIAGGPYQAIETAPDSGIFTGEYRGGVGSRDIKAGSLQAGTQIRMECVGSYTTPSDSSGATLTVTASLLGGNVTPGSSDIVLATDTPPTLPASATARPLRIAVLCTVRAVRISQNPPNVPPNPLVPANNLVCDGTVTYSGAAVNSAMNTIHMPTATHNLDTFQTITPNLQVRLGNFTTGTGTPHKIDFTNGFYKWELAGQGGLW